MTDDLKTKIAEAIKRAVADALHDGYDNAFANKSEWTAERGYRKGAFHDINEPMKGDYDGAGDQATKAATKNPKNDVFFFIMCIWYIIFPTYLYTNTEKNSIAQNVKLLILTNKLQQSELPVLFLLFKNDISRLTTGGY